MIIRASSLPSRPLQSLRISIKHTSRHISNRATTQCPGSKLPSYLSQSRYSPLERPSVPSIYFQAFTTVRHASTSAPPPVIEAAPSEPESSPYYAEPSTIFDDFDAGASITPHIGYLKEMGIDFGWGPSSMVQWLVEHIHVYAGTPWWATLVITAAVVRVALFKFFMESSDQGARMAMLKPKYEPLSAKIRAAKAAKDQVLMMSLSNDLRAMWKESGVKPWKGFLPIVLQLPIGFGTFRLLKNMYDVPIPGMVDGGALWFQDLTVPDPLFILPISMGFVSYLTLKITQNPRVSTLAPSTAKLMRTFLPIMGAGFMILYPACMQVTFLTTTTLAAGQSWLLFQPQVRAWLNLQPLVEYPPTQTITAMFNFQQGEKPKQEEAKKPGIITSSFSEIKEAGADVMQRGRKVSEGEKTPGGRSKRDLKEARAYEERRRREIAQAKFELEQEKDERRREREEGRRRR